MSQTANSFKQLFTFLLAGRDSHLWTFSVMVNENTQGSLQKQMQSLHFTSNPASLLFNTSGSTVGPKGKAVRTVPILGCTQLTGDTHSVVMADSIPI